MDKYAAYTLRDFLQDESFIRWVKYPDAESTNYWTRVRLAYPRQGAVMEKARRLIQSLASFYPEVPDAEIEKGWQGVARRSLAPETPVLRRIRFYWSAAAVLLLALGGIGWQLLKPEPPSFTEKITVQAGKTEGSYENKSDTTRRISLSDGSTVTLSPGTSIRWVARDSSREVHLEGEACFTVTRNPAQPFYVLTPQLTTKVLGTRFKVTAYPNQHVKVEVNSGRVQVYRSGAGPDAGENKSIILHPNQQVLYAPEDVKLIRGVVDVPKILIPKEQLQAFVYTDAPISDVFEGIEEVYGIRIVYDKEKFKDCKLNMSLSDESLFEKLELIGKMVEARYNLIDGEVIFIGDGCSN